MPKHPIIVLAVVLLAAVALAQVTNFASAPDVSPAEAGTAEGAAVATPNHDPQRLRHNQPTTETAEITATPNHDARHGRPTPPFFALSMMTLRAEPEPAAPSIPAASTPALSASAPSAPEPSTRALSTPAPSDPAFVDADTTLYAKNSARLRAAPSTEADVLTNLAANAPLHAIARSTDGAWWRVSLAGGDIGYVHRVAVTEYRVTKTNPALEARAPVVAAEAPQSAPARHGQTFLNYVDRTVNWFNETAAHGTAPKLIRPER